MKEKILVEVLKRLKRSDMNHQIKSYLKSQDLSDEEIDLYISTAKNKIIENKLKTLPRMNKLIFYGSVILSSITFISYVFILPRMGFTQTTILAVLGSIIFTLSLFYAFSYYKSWEEERIKIALENKNNYGSVTSEILLFATLPTLIFFFLFSFILKNGKDDFLKRTKIETEGVIVSGSSTNVGTIRRGTANFSSVTVKFLNQEGKTVHSTEDVSEYEFKNFYQGQKVKLIYSSEDENNISLLVNKSDILKFTGGEERDFKAIDLTKLIEINKNQEVLNYLNKVTYGWSFKDDKNCWVHEGKKMLFTKNNRTITLLTGTMFAMLKFPKGFQKLGFKDITEGEIKNAFFQKQRILENEKYHFKIEKVKLIDNVPYYTSTLVKK